MKTPKLLYHGTTKARYELGIKHEGLRGDMPRHMKADLKHMGYVYLCESLKDACFYAIYQIAMDNFVTAYKPLNDIIPTGLVITINVREFIDSIEIDPEQAKWEEEYKRIDPNLYETYKKIFGGGKWYRYKGNIKTKNMVQFLDVPIDKQDPDMVKFLNNQAVDNYHRNQAFIKETEG